MPSRHDLLAPHHQLVALRRFDAGKPGTASPMNHPKNASKSGVSSSGFSPVSSSRRARGGTGGLIRRGPILRLLVGTISVQMAGLAVRPARGPGHAAPTHATRLQHGC